jgi:hypothetical protein
MLVRTWIFPHNFNLPHLNKKDTIVWNLHLDDLRRSLHLEDSDSDDSKNLSLFIVRPLDVNASRRFLEDSFSSAVIVGAILEMVRQLKYVISIFFSHHSSALRKNENEA